MNHKRSKNNVHKALTKSDKYRIRIGLQILTVGSLALLVVLNILSIAAGQLFYANVYSDEVLNFGLIVFLIDNFVAPFLLLVFIVLWIIYAINPSKFMSFARSRLGSKVALPRKASKKGVGWLV